MSEAVAYGRRTMLQKNIFIVKNFFEIDVQIYENLFNNLLDSRMQFAQYFQRAAGNVLMNISPSPFFQTNKISPENLSRNCQAAFFSSSSMNGLNNHNIIYNEYCR